MKKIFRRKTIFLSIIISLIFLTASTVSPAFLDSEKMNLLKRDSDYINTEFDKYKDLTLKEIFYSFEKNQNLRIKNEIFESIIDSNFFDLPLSVLYDLFERIIPFDNVNDFKRSINNIELKDLFNNWPTLLNPSPFNIHV